jgi:hypothetical protein
MSEWLLEIEENGLFLKIEADSYEHALTRLLDGEIDLEADPELCVNPERWEEIKREAAQPVGLFGRLWDTFMEWWETRRIY